ncbi:MAG TPA: pitrilysin family protein [Longimicrobiales bacterium]
MSAPARSQPPSPGPIRPFAFPRLERRRLENGLTVIAARAGDLPLVTAALLVDAGAASDPAGKAGLAHLTARALETGTRARSAEEVAWAFERLGVEFEAAANWDAASAHITVPAERIEPALELFAEVVRSPVFPDHEVARLRDEQLAEIMQRRKEPRALASDMAARFIFAPEVPYARPLIGTATSVTGLQRDDVEAFYRAHYLPNTASLILVGAIDIERAERLGRRFFGDWPPATPPTTEFEVVGAVRSTTIFVVDRPGSVQSEIRIGDVGVQRQHPDYFPLLVMNTILGGAFTSRLNLSLRERHGFTYGARSAFIFRRQPGPFLVQAAVATDVTARAVEEALKEIALLREKGASEEETAAARDYLAGILPLELQTTEQLAARIGDIVTFGLPDSYFQDYGASLARVTPDDVHRVARTHLRSGRLAIVVIGDAEQVTGPLRALGVGPVEVHRVEE